MGQVSTDIIHSMMFHDPDATMPGPLLADLNHASPSIYSIRMFKW